MTVIPAELAPPLKRLKLGPVLDTLPERVGGALLYRTGPPRGERTGSSASNQRAHVNFAAHDSADTAANIAADTHGVSGRPDGQVCSRAAGQCVATDGMCCGQRHGRDRMRRRGRPGAPTDEQLLAALGRLVEVEGIVKASERLGVSHRTAANCHESRQVSRKMSGTLHKYVRGQRNQVRVETEREEQAPTPAAHESRGGEEARRQESEQDSHREIEGSRAPSAMTASRTTRRMHPSPSPVRRRTSDKEGGAFRQGWHRV